MAPGCMHHDACRIYPNDPRLAGVPAGVGSCPASLGCRGPRARSRESGSRVVGQATLACSVRGPSRWQLPVPRPDLPSANSRCSSADTTRTSAPSQLVSASQPWLAVSQWSGEFHGPSEAESQDSSQLRKGGRGGLKRIVGAGCARHDLTTSRV